MYAFVDRPLTSLDPGGRFLIWAMRSWVTAMQRNRCPCSVIAPAFARWNMIAGLPSFHAMMLMFNKEALEDFDFGPIACNRVHEHEAIILSLVHAMGTARPDAVRSTLALTISEDAIANVLTAISDIGRIMGHVGIFPGVPAA